jgi:hypothetical protein
VNYGACFLRCRLYDANVANKHLDDIARIIAQIERAAYQKGWNDALAHVVNVARNPMPPDQQQSLPLHVANGKHDDGSSNGQPTMVETVNNIIVQQPGLRGADIVSALHKKMPDKQRKSIDRTARTAIMRLKKRHKIESISGKWYPAGTGNSIKTEDL